MTRLAHFRHYLSLALVFAALASCASAPQYDATTDSGISSLQKEIDTQLVQWMVDIGIAAAEQAVAAAWGVVSSALQTSIGAVLHA